MNRVGRFTPLQHRPGKAKDLRPTFGDFEGNHGASCLHRSSMNCHTLPKCEETFGRTCDKSYTTRAVGSDQ